MKRYYPQLLSGTSAQYPFRRTIQRRSVVNDMADGSVIKSVDSDFGRIQWELTYERLTDRERTEFESFFHDVQGSLHTFSFVDPTDNLLLWSEDLSRPGWSNDPLLSTEGIGSEGPGSHPSTLCTNGAQIAQGFHQVIESAPWHTHCFSCLVSSPSDTDITMIMSSDDGALTSEARVTSEWQRITCRGAIAGAASELKCSLLLAPGGRITVSELHVCAQQSLGEYRVTTSRNAVYPKTRFASDQLRFNTTGPDFHSTKITLVSSHRH